MRPVELLVNAAVHPPVRPKVHPSLLQAIEIELLSVRAPATDANARARLQNVYLIHNCMFRAV